MKLGARIFKTGLSVIVAIYIAMFLNIETTMIAAIAAALSVFPSVYRSWKHLLNQLQANALGAVFAILATLTIGTSPVAIGFVIILVIALNTKLKLSDTIGVSIVTIIAIMQIPEGNYYLFAFQRFLLVMIGIFSALLVNFLFMPPKYETTLMNNLRKTSDELLTLLRVFLEEENIGEKTYQEEKKRIRKDAKDIDDIFEFYKDEFHHVFKKQGYHEAKKLVIFQSMSYVIKKELALLKLIKRQLLPNPNIPDDVKNEIKNALFYLASYNERIFFKYDKELILKQPYEVSKDLVQQNKQLTAKLMNYYKQNELEQWYLVLPIVSGLIDLANELEKLDQRVDHFLRREEQKKNS